MGGGLGGGIGSLGVMQLLMQQQQSQVAQQLMQQQAQQLMQPGVSARCPRAPSGRP